MPAPPPQGLYTGRHEHDSCGVAFVATLTGDPSRDIVDHAFTALRNLRHRGASGSEPDSGDGAGILVQIPDVFLRAAVDFELPPAGSYAAGLVFLPHEDGPTVTRIGELAAEEKLAVLGWRDVPVHAGIVGTTARRVMPRIRQVFVRGDAGEAGLDLDRRTYRLRKRAERETEAYFPSLSARTLVYKGMLTPDQLRPFFLDLSDPRFASALALVHSRFSTNTFPSWPLAHPYRFIAHNGEINTVMGNRNWMRAREATLATAHIPGRFADLFPVLTAGGSDSASFDEALELLTLGGYELPHAVLMMIPEAWENDARMDAARRAFYAYHAGLMEAWDGPASITFTDGSLVGAVLDRNGLRPGRFWVTDDGLVVLASEAGVLDIEPSRVVRKGRLQPGRMFLVDLDAGRIIEDDEIKARLAAAHPYQAWLDANLTNLPQSPSPGPHEGHHHPVGRGDGHIHLPGDRGNGATTRPGQQRNPPPTQEVAKFRSALLHQHRLFGYTEEELRVLVAPMARDGAEPIGSMGTDTPLAVLSERPRLLFDYFTQLFAQVTNPPLDAIREELVTSLQVRLGPQDNLLAPGPDACRQIVLPYPVLDHADLAALRQLRGFPAATITATYPVAGGGASLRERLTEVCAQASAAIGNGAAVLVLSDRCADADHAPVPSLLLTGAVHHHLVREKTRTRVGLVVEAGDAREVHHIALLLGYGANAVHPYVALDSAEELGGTTGGETTAARRNLVMAYAKGVLKVMSKMGVSTVASYTGAQIFEALGLGEDLVQAYFTGTTSRLGGIGLDEIAEEVRRRHQRAYGRMAPHRRLEVGGEYQWRREGEPHLFDPETVFRLQHATRTRQYEIFKQYTQRVDEQSARLMTLRGLFQLRNGLRPPVQIDEVEPVSEIVKRFNTGAMSYGSISLEAHQTLAIAMNRLGGRSNTGEGGEDPDRLHDPLRRSAVKQVASGRFGVTAEYLTNASDLQIKMAQGAKPGEGGQLPGPKVYPWIAKTRYSTPGVGLISPPPHHDIYSIEDLAQLIHDLKNSNPIARIHVKLVAEVGVGTVAAGVSKAHADVVLISGHDGGTGASPLTSIKHAGAPWELGLAETQQTLLLNGLRDRIVVQTDGQLKTGRDVIVAALLGAEEFGFATAPLVVSGCVMMRVCHLDTCPVGVATQNPELRTRFTGKPEFVETFFEFIAQEVREYLAALGFRSISEAVGLAELLDTSQAVDHWKASGLDLTPILHVPERVADATRRCTTIQDHGLTRALDHQLISLARPALDAGEPVRAQLPIRNINRTVGTMLGHEVTKRYAGAGLPDETIDFTFIGSAGQSFGAFLPAGVTLRLEGDANDYLAKGLSGGRVVVRPDRTAPFAAEHNVVAGNVVAYGATGGELFVRGLAGERFCVRNSGATAVVEGVGDHGCEYMTGGLVVVLGRVGRNFAAGMSGGVAYVLDLDPSLVNAALVGLGPLDQTDETELLELVRRHGEETESSVAAALLADWPEAMRRFTKVMPEDFKRVLAARAAAERDGLSDDAATELMMEAAHG
jgi:glutamate synthase (NADPH) large chain